MGDDSTAVFAADDPTPPFNHAHILTSVLLFYTVRTRHSCYSAA